MELKIYNKFEPLDCHNNAVKTENFDTFVFSMQIPKII